MILECKTNNWNSGRLRVLLAILKKNELSCDTKEDNMASTDFALDEIFVCIYKVFNKCWIFFTYQVI